MKALKSFFFSISNVPAVFSLKTPLAKIEFDKLLPDSTLKKLDIIAAKMMQTTFFS